MVCCGDYLNRKKVNFQVFLKLLTLPIITSSNALEGVAESYQEQVKFVDFLERLTLPKRVSSIGVMRASETYQEEGQAEVLVGYSELRCGNVTLKVTGARQGAQFTVLFGT